MFNDPIRRPSPRGSHLPPYSEPMGNNTGIEAPGPTPPPGMRSPRKLTVTRVAALRSRELTSRGVQMFHRATTADGADKSGLTSLTYAVMANYAADAAMAVALAGTLFFAAATAESTGRVLLYLVITVAPFAVIAPFIGPMLDRLQSGRRLALAVSSFGRALLAVLMAFNFASFNPWVIYPCALGNLVLSKAFGVLKAALTPRVLPEQITLVKTNSRLTTFGMIAGGVAGAVAAGLSKVTGSPGALFFTAACAIAGGVLCLRIPAWVESTEGEVPVKDVGSGKPTKGFPRIVTATLWSNSMIRVETGFLALFIAFVVKSQYPSPQHSAFTQLLLLGVVGGAAGVGGFVGNTMGARLTLSAPENISIFALISVLVSTVVAVLVPGLATAALVGFVGSTASALAKVSLDSVIQHHLPEESRASAFGISESVLQLGWVFGGVIGLLLGGVWTFGHANVYAIGFGTITLLLVTGLVQSYLVRSGRTMVPKLRRGGTRGRSGRRKDVDGSQDSGVGTRGTASGRGDTDRLTRPAPAATAHLPVVEPKARRQPRKAGGDR
jgi:MFS family permease